MDFTVGQNRKDNLAKNLASTSPLELERTFLFSELSLVGFPTQIQRLIRSDLPVYRLASSSFTEHWTQHEAAPRQTKNWGIAIHQITFHLVGSKTNFDDLPTTRFESNIG